MWKEDIVSDVKKIYFTLDRVSIFKDMPQCGMCEGSCRAPQWMRWLLPDEAEGLADIFGSEIIKVGNVFFFKTGQCRSFRKGEGCAIYERRPLECRLSPIHFLRIGGELWWTLVTYCPIIGTAERSQLDQIKARVTACVRSVESVMSPVIEAQIVDICDAIQVTERLVEGVDFVRVVELGIDRRRSA